MNDRFFVRFNFAVEDDPFKLGLIFYLFRTGFSTGKNDYLHCNLFLPIFLSLFYSFLAYNLV